MLQRKLGKDGPQLPALGLGCMGMSEFYGERNDEESFKTLDRALELGCRFWDTSDMYGPFTNEELLGRALKGRREKLFLATKFGFVRLSGSDPMKRAINGRPEYVAEACEASLKRLGTDCIDLYYLHRVDPETPVEDTVGAMAKLVRDGKVRYLGLSEAGAGTLEKAQRVHPIAALQSEYSLWSRDIEASVLPTLRRLGIALVAYSPLGRGFLTGEIRKLEDFSQGDYRRFSPRFQEGNFEKNLELVARVRDLAQKKGCSVAQLALAWVLAQGEDVLAIPGTKKVKYLEDNWEAQELHLSLSELAALDEAFPSGSVSGTRYPEAMMKFTNFES
jgi:aryl-alcohol dehydrogenase-like predicted oxidoreductase